MNNSDKIAFVIPYVNGDDPAWRDAFVQAGGLYNNSFSHGWPRYKDAGTCELLLQSLEKFAPWGDIYMIVAMPSQIPEYAKNRGIKFIYHSDFLPDNLKPCVFQSNAIETFIGCMNLPEKFIWMNDDIIFLKPVKPEDFFDGDIPRNNLHFEDVGKLNYNTSNYAFFFPGVFKKTSSEHGPSPMRYSWCNEFYEANKEKLIKSVGSITMRESFQLNQLMYLLYAHLFKETAKRNLPGVSTFGTVNTSTLRSLSWACINEKYSFDTHSLLEEVRKIIGVKSKEKRKTNTAPMDILYIIGEGFSKCDYNELRYSLRSLEKYGTGINRVFVVGYCPEWLSNKVIKLPFTQPYGKDSFDGLDEQEKMDRKHANMLASILYAIDNSDIGEEFLVSMDDHIYIRPTDFSNYPFYCKKRILPEHGTSAYRKFLARVRKILERQGLTTFFLTLHRNMPLSRKIITECREFLEKAIKELLPVEPFVYLNNYRYTKYQDFHPKHVTDYKLKGGGDWWKANPSITEVISTYDFEKGSGIDHLLEGMFNKKSKYEL